MSATPLPAVIVEQVDLIDQHESIRAIASVHVTGFMFIHGIRIVQARGKLRVEMPVITFPDGAVRPILEIVNGRLRHQISDAVVDVYRTLEATV